MSFEMNSENIFFLFEFQTLVILMRELLDKQRPAKPSTEAGGDGKRLIVVLCESSLETVKVGSGKEGRYALLNCDDHGHILAKHKRYFIFPLPQRPFKMSTRYHPPMSTHAPRLSLKQGRSTTSVRTYRR